MKQSGDEHPDREAAVGGDAAVDRHQGFTSGWASGRVVGDGAGCPAPPARRRSRPPAAGGAARQHGRGGGQLGLERGELALDLGRGAHLVRAWPGCRRCSSSGRSVRPTPGARRWRRPAPASAAILSSARCMVGAGVAHRPRDPGHGLADPGLGLGGGVGRLQRLLAGPERGHLGLEALGGLDELVLLGGDLGVLGLEVGELGGDGRPPASAPRGPGPRGSGRGPDGPVPGAWPPAAGAGWPGSRSACGPWPPRRCCGASSGCSRAASRRRGRGCRGGPRPGRAACWSWPGRCSGIAGRRPWHPIA